MLVLMCCMQSVFKKNAGIGSGAVTVLSGNVTAQNCQFIENTVEGATVLDSYGGAALYLITGTTANYIATAVIRGCEFLNNESKDTGTGGAIRNVGGNLTVISSVFKQNSAESGTIAGSDGCLMTVDTCTFRSNSASQFGAAIQVYDAVQVTITNSSFIANVASISGGAIAVANATDLTVTKVSAPQSSNKLITTVISIFVHVYTSAITVQAATLP
jgi:predicted outer membrane repeat protein